MSLCPSQQILRAFVRDKAIIYGWLGKLQQRFLEVEGRFMT